MTRCDLRSHSECACRPGECSVAPMRLIMDTSDTPIIRFSVGQQFFVILLLTAFMASIGWAALSSANEAYRKQALIEQESNVAWKR